MAGGWKHGEKKLPVTPDFQLFHSAFQDHVFQAVRMEALRTSGFSPPGGPRPEGRRGSLPLLSIGVSAALPSRAQLAQDQIGRNDSDDRLVVSLARAVFELFLPTEDKGNCEVFRSC